MTMTKLDELRKMKDEYLARMRQDGEAAIKEAVKVFFDQNPTVKAVRWTGYIPAFNDGDVCVFGLGDVEVSFDEIDPDFTEYPEDKALRASMGDLRKSLYSVEDVLQTIFGDNHQVTIDSSGHVTVDDYDCGY